MTIGRGKDALTGLEKYLTRDVETVGVDLEDFAETLVKWQKVQNLVSRETLPSLWQRHMRDSLQILPFLTHNDSPIDDLVFVDIGSGGGFPAIPLAIALKSERIHYHLIEANQRKASFLRTVARVLNLSATVHNQRVENVNPEVIGAVDIVTCRATAPLIDLLGYALPFWGVHTRGLFHKGREYGEEVIKAGSEWAFDVVGLASETDPDGGILDVRNLRRLPRN